MIDLFVSSTTIDSTTAGSSSSSYRMGFSCKARREGRTSRGYMCIAVYSGYQ